jgi:hypothetical protein
LRVARGADDSHGDFTPVSNQNAAQRLGGIIGQHRRPFVRQAMLRVRVSTGARFWR